MNIRPVILIAACSFLFACSSDDDANAVVATMAADFNGTYALTATPTTLVANDGGVCNEATGNIVVAEGVISGPVTTISGNTTFDVTGEVMDDGQVTGGFASAGEQFAEYTGGFESDGVGSGDWEDSFGCAGTWEAILQATE